MGSNGGRSAAEAGGQEIAAEAAILSCSGLSCAIWVFASGGGWRGYRGRTEGAAGFPLLDSRHGARADKIPERAISSCLSSQQHRKRRATPRDGSGGGTAESSSGAAAPPPMKNIRPGGWG